MFVCILKIDIFTLFALKHNKLAPILFITYHQPVLWHSINKVGVVNIKIHKYTYIYIYTMEHINSSI